MKYLLDTNAVIALLRDLVSKVAVRGRQERPEDLAISAIVTYELFYGAFKSRRPAANTSIFDALRFTILDFDGDDARKAGEIRAYLAAHGTAVGPYDVLIAGQAVARGLVLVTHNTREFGRVPGLQIEDWEA